MNPRGFKYIALCLSVTLASALAQSASAAPVYKVADFSGGLNSVTSTFKSRLTAAGFDSSLFNCSSCAGATSVSGHVIFDASVPIPGSGFSNVFSIGAIANVANAAIFEIDIDGISLRFGDAGIQGGPAIQYKNGVFNGFFFADDFASPNASALELNVQGGVFNLLLSATNQNLFTGFLNIGPEGLTNIRDFSPTDVTPPRLANEVPEPASLALFSAGLFGLGALRRRKAKA